MVNGPGRRRVLPAVGLVESTSRGWRAKRKVALNAALPEVGSPSWETALAAMAIVWRPWLVTGFTVYVNVAVLSSALRVTPSAGWPLTTRTPGLRLAGAMGSENLMT